MRGFRLHSCLSSIFTFADDLNHLFFSRDVSHSSFCVLRCHQRAVDDVLQHFHSESLSFGADSSRRFHHNSCSCRHVPGTDVCSTASSRSLRRTFCMSQQWFASGTHFGRIVQPMQRFLLWTVTNLILFTVVCLGTAAPFWSCWNHPFDHWGQSI